MIEQWSIVESSRFLCAPFPPNHFTAATRPIPIRACTNNAIFVYYMDVSWKWYLCETSRAGDEGRETEYRMRIYMCVAIIGRSHFGEFRKRRYVQLNVGSYCSFYWLYKVSTRL